MSISLGQIVARALREPDLRRKLLAEPKQTLHSMDVSLPEIQNITVLESTETQAFFILPLLSSAEIQQLQEELPTLQPSRSIRSRILIKAMQDPDYKSHLLRDPKAVLKAEGMPIPDSMSLTALENTSDQLYIVLPHVHSHSHSHSH